ncbi:MAG: hypothetical protein WCR42_05240 [bacterium]
MPEQQLERKKYYELSEKTTLQSTVLLFCIVFCTIFAFLMILPTLQYLMTNFLNGEINNDGATHTILIADEPQVSKKLNPEEWAIAMKSIEERNFVPMSKTSYFSNWAVDLNSQTSEASRFWINPILAVMVPSFIIGLILSLYLTLLMPVEFGFFRRCVEREIVYNLDKICFIRNGFYSADENREIEALIMKASIHEMHNFEKEWNIPIDNIKILLQALKWRSNSLIYKLIHPLRGLNVYMRLYFTEKYGNPILGMVYIGAAVLIIIIGLRGLKFIPASQPSLIFFALGLEFSLLFLYAFTLIFSKPEDVNDIGEPERETAKAGIFASTGNSHEIENLLRVFINKKNN